MTKKQIIGKIILYIVLILLAIGMLVPFAWMISASLKAEKDVFAFPIQWIPTNPKWSNYVKIWKKVPLLIGFRNTIVITVVATTLQVITSSFAAYAFAKLTFKGRDTIFLAYVMTIAIPWQVYMVPQFIMIKNMGLTDSLVGLILMQSFTATGVFLMRQFYIGIPNELLEAARIDGLSEYGIWAKIMLPLSKAAIATLIIQGFVFEWNDFMGPLIYLSSSNKKTVQLMLRMFNTQYSSNYALIMAAATVSLIPVFVLFIFLQRYFVQGIAAAGIKG
ncbi:MAG: carbohydrate ABC transporter permease [Lachnospiraceae bacterium]|jgi:multiple sugar transport system permease protein|nr:carbohydrate ABC transporter permease [Lachnospiraceae bacterium]MCH4070961.1 carbohydrate ABC transporter permease [Lachnospiraceae bacterium]MCH4107952.1 carbohydrate ABC transporter permease [Lachnospiraceae bacterium]MCI1302415.1 carbohydrate ABC transporter permease [Lachnospiraceae bacterium]MCI1332467.1 carbohydrate ABC transporter permease [Lachnospiraceae bacterium]